MYLKECVELHVVNMLMSQAVSWISHMRDRVFINF